MMLWLAPVACLALLALVLPVRLLPWVGRLLILVLVLSLIALWSGLIHAADPLATYFYSVVAILSAFGLWYSEPYLEAERRHHGWSAKRVRGYTALLIAFIGSLVAVAVVQNYVLLWVAMEAATLTSVFLTSVPGDSRATEAAWKYLFVTEVGGFAALVGTVLLLTQAHVPLASWTLDPRLVPGGPMSPLLPVGAFLALLGYATKAGLAPVHTWLPDAHSEAPAPVSALLSGLKLAGASLIAYRLLHLAGKIVPAFWLQDALVLLGLLSLVVAASLVVFQTDLKRLWAYSSIEHIGLVSLGMGFGGIALVGAMLHIWTHGVTKTLLFQNAGTVRIVYGSSRLEDGARGIVLQTPWSGGLLALGTAAILGLPPFAPFWSEWLILAGGITNPHWRWETAVAIALLVAIFAGVTRRLPGWLWTPGNAHVRPRRRPEPWPLLLPTLALAVLVVTSGLGAPLLWPHFWHHLLGELGTLTL